MRGGARVGGGRPKGSKDMVKRTAAKPMPIKKADDGMSPLDIMLSVMRYHWDQAMACADGPDLAHMKVACEVAKDAAPYLHARLTTIQGGPPDKPIRFESQKEEDRDAARRVLFLLEKAVRPDPSLAVRT